MACETWKRSQLFMLTLKWSKKTGMSFSASFLRNNWLEWLTWTKRRYIISEMCQFENYWIRNRKHLKETKEVVPIENASPKKSSNHRKTSMHEVHQNLTKELPDYRHCLEQNPQIVSNRHKLFSPFVWENFDISRKKEGKQMSVKKKILPVT